MSEKKYRKKLIEVALPLEAINVASAREKSIRHGHPSTLHLWWARRPLAACRAVLFASLVNDPEDDPMYGIDENTAYTERAKLFDLIEQLVQWENSNNPRVINAARLEIARSIAANKVADKELKDDTPLVANAPELPEEQAKYMPEPPPEYTAHDVRFKMPSLKPEQVNHFLAHYAPPVLDPFAGGGSIPLEAQRLGLRAYASDLNPVPVLINKALIEIPPKFAGQPPVNPDARKGKLKSKQWNGAEGLADDVRYYGKWMRDEAEKRIGHLYPKVKVTQEMADDGRLDLEPYVGQELTVIAWLWARTVKSPNPAAKGAHVPLIKNYWLSKRKGKETFLRPRINQTSQSYVFDICFGKANNGFDPSEGTVSRIGGKCLLSETPIPFSYIRENGKQRGLDITLLSVVVEGTRERIYLPALPEHVEITFKACPDWKPEHEMPHNPFSVRPPLYGIEQFDELFTERQLTALGTLVALAQEAVNEIKERTRDNPTYLSYAESVGTFLAFSIDKLVDLCNMGCPWEPVAQCPRNLFGRQAMPMHWNFAEGNPLGSSSGSFDVVIDNFYRNLTASIPNAIVTLGGSAGTCDAKESVRINDECIVSTDPPYYNNVDYADLSDFFYVWLRRCLGEYYPELFATLLTPKGRELVATPYRFAGDKGKAKEFFESGLRSFFDALSEGKRTEFPITIYYAFKQVEGADDLHQSSTGWETMLSALLKANFLILGTWPIRTELTSALKREMNALASSIVLVCRPHDEHIAMVTRRDFANTLRKELPDAIKHLQSGNVAPVDLAQASIGPGMAVFSRYSKVINADGSSMSVREALQLINQMLDESLVEQEADFDSETRFAIRWFEQYGLKEGPFGDAETLAKAMAVAVRGVVEAGIAKSGAGKVRLLKREELDPNWDPKTDTRLTMWEVMQHLIHRLETGGEMAAAELVRDVSGERGEIAKELAYRLYQTCDRKKWADEALRYNAFVASWPEIVRLSRQKPASQQQGELELTD